MCKQKAIFFTLSTSQQLFFLGIKDVGFVSFLSSTDSINGFRCSFNNITESQIILYIQIYIIIENIQTHEINYRIIIKNYQLLKAKVRFNVISDLFLSFVLWKLWKWLKFGRVQVSNLWKGKVNILWPFQFTFTNRTETAVKTKQHYQNCFFQDGSKTNSIAVEDFLVVTSYIEMNFKN